MNKDMYDFEYIGNLHIHSHYSDGINSVEEIAGVAADVGLEFICINDHMHLTEFLNLDDEGFYGNVLVLVGSEIGRRYHHYLAFNIKKNINPDNLPPQEVIDQVNAQGGFGFLAHPFEKGMPFTEKSLAYTWNDLSVTDYAGICIWNFSSRWKERVKTVFHGIFFLIFKCQTLKGPSRKTLAFWDEQCKKRRMVAIGGSDAHGSLFHWGPIRLQPLPYHYVLNTVNVHLILETRLDKDFQCAKNNIYEVLKQGRLFIANDRLSPARGFRFSFAFDSGPELFMGEEDQFNKGVLVIEAPAYGEIRLIKDGVLERTWRGTRAVYKVSEKGVYRVEVYKYLFLFGWRPWIFSNPIYLR